MNSLSLKNLTNALSEVDSWQQLGVQLDINYHKLKEFGILPTVEECKLAMLQFWLDNDVQASWEKLICGLKKMGLNRVVQDIQREYQLTSNAHSEKMIVPAKSEHFARVAPPSAPLTEQLVQSSTRRQREVRQEVDILKGKYDDLFMKTVESFKEKHAETPTFLSKLRTSIAILPSSLKDEHIHFLEKKSSEIANATSVDELFIIVNCYSDFYNCSLVVYIIERFGGDKLRQDLQNYTEEFEAFCSRTNLADFVAALTGSQEIPPDFLKLVLKMGPQWELRTLKDLEQFHKTLKGRSFLASHAVRLMGGETGSIFLIWSVPRTCSDFLISSLDPYFLQQCNIEGVTVDGEDLEEYRREHRVLDLHAVSSKYVNLTSEGLAWASGVGCLEDVVFFLSTGVEVNRRVQWPGRTALMLASEGDHLEVVRKLLKAQAHVNVQDEDDMTALMWASISGHTDTVRALLSAGAQLDLQDESGMTALMLASEGGHLDVVRELLKAQADVNVQDQWPGRTALMLASEGGHLDVVRELLKTQADVNVQDEDDMNALMWASIRGHTDTVSALLSAGAQVNLQDECEGRTALMLASEDGHLDVVRQLLKAQADVNVQDKRRRTVLMLASKGGHLDVVRELLKAQADVNVQDEWGKSTALMLASEGGHLDVVRELLKAQADVNVQDELGRTALMWASDSGRSDTVGVLLSAGAQVNLQDEDDWTALMWASINGNTEIVGMLLSAGAQVDLQDECEGKTALILASENGHLDVVRQLLNAQTDVNIQDKDGMTAVMKASIGGHTDIVQVLLSAGAQVDLQDEDDWTALMWASVRGHTDTVRALLSAGAQLDLQDKDGSTALMWASGSGHTDTMRALLSAGAQVDLQDEDNWTAS